MNIERLAASDLKSLANLFIQFWGQTSSIPKMVSAFGRLANNPAYILLAAKTDDRLIGFAMGIICEELYGDCRPFMVVEDVIVDRSQRRNNVGSALMHTLEKFAILADCKQIILVTEANRTQALRFYKALGYQSEPFKGFKKQL